MRNPFFLAALLGVLAACDQSPPPAATGGVPAGSPTARPAVTRPLTGKLPPELVSGTGARWLNTDQPLSLKQLLGRVVWVEFSFIH